MPLQNQHSRRRAWSSVSAAGCVLCKRRLLKLSLLLSTRCCAPACVVVCLRSAFARLGKRGRDHPSLPHTTPRSSGYLLRPPPAHCPCLPVVQLLSLHVRHDQLTCLSFQEQERVEQEQFGSGESLTKRALLVPLKNVQKLLLVSVVLITV